MYPKTTCALLAMSYRDPTIRSSSRVRACTAVNAPGPPSLAVFARRASMILGWWVRGLARPTPFFDDRTKAPPATPCVLTRRERDVLVRT
jgi:hypothetical protein